MKRIEDAILSLVPTAAFSCDEGKYESIVWVTDGVDLPSKSDVLTELARLQAEEAKVAYQGLRALEYPPITDYLDAVVKGDLEQQQAYIDACLAIKAKYPKPEGV